MPWVVRDAIDDINRTVVRRWQFWSRMGYRPLWTGWEVRPAASLR